MIRSTIKILKKIGEWWIDWWFIDRDRRQRAKGKGEAKHRAIESDEASRKSPLSNRGMFPSTWFLQSPSHSFLDPRTGNLRTRDERADAMRSSRAGRCGETSSSSPLPFFLIIPTTFMCELDTLCFSMTRASICLETYRQMHKQTFRPLTRRRKMLCKKLRTIFQKNWSHEARRKLFNFFYGGKIFLNTNKFKKIEDTKQKINYSVFLRFQKLFKYG